MAALPRSFSAIVAFDIRSATVNALDIIVNRIFIICTVHIIADRMMPRYTHLNC